MIVNTLKLLLPIFIPSWIFFNVIAPSPRIEFVLRRNADDEISAWQELQLRPQQLSVIDMLKSLFYNPSWNEALFMMNCAESLIINPTEFSEQEILQRMINRLEHDKVADLNITPHLQFRLVFISRQGSELQKDVLYTSRIYKVCEELVV